MNAKVFFIKRCTEIQMRVRMLYITALVREASRKIYTTVLVRETFRKLYITIFVRELSISQHWSENLLENFIC